MLVHWIWLSTRTNVSDRVKMGLLQHFRDAEDIFYADADAYAVAGVPFELHIYPDGPHGMALSNRITWSGNPKYNQPAIAEWVRLAAAWAESLS